METARQCCASLPVDVPDLLKDALSGRREISLFLLSFALLVNCVVELGFGCKTEKI